MLDQFTIDCDKYARLMDDEEVISEELCSLIDTPEGEGLERQVEFWVVGTDEEPEAEEIIERLAGLSMLEESFYSDAYDLAGGK